MGKAQPRNPSAKITGLFRRDPQRGYTRNSKKIDNPPNIDHGFIPQGLTGEHQPLHRFLFEAIQA
jgi:hypothetical protein